jgi:glycosyltransferase involved in cell wall biosynthesis
LCAGTVELRKNQALLLDVWEMLVATRPREDIPPLVVAGHPGQLSEETMARLTRTASLREVVVHVPSPTDAELAWLFRNCGFTVFPSRYEGWGVPVGESLDLGKFCLTADGSSLPEVGEGLTELLDPFDRGQWRDRILHYWTNPAELARRERTIAEHHRRVTIDDTARTFADLAGLEPAPEP